MARQAKEPGKPSRPDGLDDQDGLDGLDAGLRLAWMLSIDTIVDAGMDDSWLPGATGGAWSTMHELSTLGPVHC
jgi:hypothetical protein